METGTAADAIRRAGEAIKDATCILFTSGAGLGVDSGLPDFRGTEGFWRAYPPMAKLGLQFHMTSNPKWFRTDPEFAWGFFGHRYNLYSSAVPHEGYHIMKRWAEEVSARPHNNSFFVFTSNVDGQYIKAGFPQEQLLECHGSIHHLQCLKPSRCTKSCLWQASTPGAAEDSSTALGITVDPDTFRAVGTLPSCPHCHGLARPNILMFGDSDWISDRWDEQQERYERFYKRLRTGPQRLVVIEVGAGEGVPTVRNEGESMSSRFDGTFIRINPRDTAIPKRSKAILIPMGGLAALQAIDEVYRQL
eukprot:GILK01001850.1.p1 GENE.GILK01001850.1~~GILK01001850.1.p1  ORF type:complete len:318 (+),score=25.92 GILK01001850.1:41-955(+)